MKNKNRIKYLILFLGCVTTALKAQVSKPYNTAYTTLEALCNAPETRNFKKAVFTVEKAFLDNKMTEKDFESGISALFQLAKARYKHIDLDKKVSETEQMKRYASLFKVMTDTTFVVGLDETLFHPPFRYNFDDMFGRKDWASMFVSKLMATNQGNCHSMPYLYKILCDEWQIPCYMALAPNHIYIKLFTEKTGWFNTELTSASFPIDAWLMASGYINIEAIQNGIYMDTLSEKQSLALCILDLAKGYDRTYPINDGAFIVKCCDLALTHYPKSLNARILKAETKKKQFEKLMKARGISAPSVFWLEKDGKTLWDDMNSLYAQIHNLGYRAMPENMYVDWLKSSEQERFKQK